jgi:hypothetical protein
VRILLPPSEAKRPGGAGAPATPHVRLSEPRAVVAAALVDFCAGDSAIAAAALALPARSSAADLEMNRTIAGAPTLAALDRYAGTVYEGLDAATLTGAGRRRAMESVLIFSGLFGVVAADELVPAYRLPVAATLPTVGALTPFWRSVLPAELDQLLGDELVVDLRSSDYGAMWRPSPEVRERVLSVRIVTEHPDGRLAVVSYPSKFGKGQLTRALVSSRARVTSARQVAEIWTRSGGRDATVRPDGSLELVTAYVVTAPRPPAPR